MSGVWDFAAGLLTAGYLTGSLFFLKFWRRTGDRLFAAFAAAFALMAANQAIPSFLNIPQEARSGFFLLRLAAFLLIIIAILTKNLGGGRS